MREQNDPGRATALSFVSYGIHIGVRVNNRGILERVRHHFPPGWEASPRSAADRLYSFVVRTERNGSRVSRQYTLYADEKELTQASRLSDVLERFASDSQLFIGEMTKQKVFLHAGVVGWRGKAIVIPGRSHSGKTTLVAELVRAGATYYSDEYAVLDRRGRVHPYLKPLAIRSEKTGRQRNYQVESLGGVPGSHPLPVGLILVSKYKAGVRWRPKVLSAGGGVFALSDNSISIRRVPNFVLEVLLKVVSDATILKSTRGEARQVVDYLLENFSRW